MTCYQGTRELLLPAHELQPVRLKLLGIGVARTNLLPLEDKSANRCLERVNRIVISLGSRH